MSTNNKEVNVTVDTKRTEELARENERLKLEKELKDKGIELDPNDPESQKVKEEIEKEKFDSIKLDLAERTGDASFREVKTKDELKDKLNAMLKEAVDNRNRKTETPSGSAPMNPQQLGNPVNVNDLRKLPLNADTVMLLQRLRQSGNPEASQILDELWQKSVFGWRQSHQAISYSPDDNVPKTTGTPELNFDNYKGSEAQGFPQIKKSPPYYSKTHNQAGQPIKEGS
jgi:hypothetical protein